MTDDYDIGPLFLGLKRHIFIKEFDVALFFMLACLCIFTACERASELTKSPDPLGDFSLGYSVVVAPHPVAGPMSGPASDDEWIAAVKKALDQRFERY